MQVDTQSIVDDHKNMLMLTKNLSEFQHNNLKSWAFIFLDSVDNVRVSWNFIRKNKAKDFHAGKVDFKIKLKKGSEQDIEKIQAGVDQLTACTKFLFWSETKVNIKIDGKLWTSQLQSKESKISPKMKDQA